MNNLKNIGLAYRIFATDNKDQFPTALISPNAELTSHQILNVLTFLTNELSTPKILHCPTDKERRASTDFGNFTGKNMSYFASLSVSPTNSVSFLAGDLNILSNGQPVTDLLTLTTNTAATLS